MEVGADQNGLTLLEDFVETGDADVGEILGTVMRTRLVDGVMHDVVHGARGHVDVEKIAIELVNAAIGTVADEGQTESGLLEPILGDGQMEEHLVIGFGASEGIVQSGLRALALLIDKLAADIGLVGEIGNAPLTGQSLHAEAEPFVRAERLGGAVVGDSLLQSAADGNRMAHVCFLHERLAMLRTTSLGETDNSENINRSHHRTGFVTSV